MDFGQIHDIKKLNVVKLGRVYKLIRGTGIRHRGYFYKRQDVNEAKRIRNDEVIKHLVYLR